ncbi:cytochrome P450 [Podospora appendiculata]|uniref:Cytochrome P450 n=1 Tax=Podospora appendiculata TaxID=314037 RepID=A0AAE1CC91_9PEZI|nr:cytochrome P450 [Podospora appendiculata]
MDPSSGIKSYLSLLPSLDLKVSVVGLIAVPILTLFGWLVYSWLTSPLRKYPGPFLAGWTNLWRLVLSLRGRNYPMTMRKLHEKYGPVVRIGPNLLDLDYPELIKTIFSTDDRWRKTEMYDNNNAIVDGKNTPTLFSATDPAVHARMKKPIAKYYAVGNILSFEARADALVKHFCNELERRYVNGPDGPKAFDLSEWIIFYAWDLISTLTFSRSFGYLDHGHDFDGAIAVTDKALTYFIAVAQMPFLDYLLDKNPVVRIGPPGLGNTMVRVTLEALIARRTGQDKNFDPAMPDFLQNFLDAQAATPDLVDDTIIMGYLLVNLIAGADNTSIVIRSIIYLSLKHPAVYRRLEAEILAAGFDRDKGIPYKHARQLPYFDAVVREAVRAHGAVSVALERYVPAGGLTLPDGSFVPPGIAVCMNPDVLAHNRGIYGDDVDEFRPERWLQAPGEDAETYRLRIQKWNASDLGFGDGSRVCIGKTLALLEIYKVVATLVLRYEMELTDPEKVWRLWQWSSQKDIVVKLTLRE